MLALSRKLYMHVRGEDIGGFRYPGLKIWGIIHTLEEKEKKTHNTFLSNH